MKKVLVVEDDPPIRQLVVNILVDAGYEVAAAPDGEVGLERCAQFQPDLVLLDLAMPNVDGFEFLRRRSCAAPIVVMSAGFHRQKLGPDAPVRAFVDKPFSIDELIRVVESSLTYN